MTYFPSRKLNYLAALFPAGTLFFQKLHYFHWEIIPVLVFLYKPQSWYLITAFSFCLNVGLTVFKMKDTVW